MMEEARDEYLGQGMCGVEEARLVVHWVQSVGTGRTCGEVSMT